MAHYKDDDISYRSTEFLDINNETIKLPQPGGKGGAGILIFFVMLSIIFLGVGFYIYITLNSKIKSLERNLNNRQVEATSKAQTDASQIQKLKKHIEAYKKSSLELKRKETVYKNNLNKRTKKIESLTSEKNSLENRIQALEQSIENKNNEISNLKTAKNDLSGNQIKLQNNIESYKAEIKKLNSDIAYWQRRYNKLSKDQAEAVEDVLSSAKKRNKIVHDLEQELLSTHEKNLLYQSLIGWEENFKLTGRLPISKLTQKPLLLSSSRPTYPHAERKAGIEGMVLLKGILNETGKLVNLEVLYTPQRNSHLAQAAKDAARKYRYRPASRNGQKVKIAMIVPVEFRLGRK